MDINTCFKNRFRYDIVEFILYLYLLLSPLADLMTGVLIYKVGMAESFLGSPSQLIRILFIFSIIPLLKKTELKLAAGVFCYLCTIETISFIYTQKVSVFLSGFNYFMKILYIILFYKIINKIHEKSDETLFKTVKIYLNSACLYSLGILIPTLLGIGITSYETEGTFGQKGLFASGNALNIYLGIALSIALLKKNKDKIDTLKVIIILSAIVMLGTKTAFLFIIVAFLLYIRNKPNYIRNSIIIAIASILYLYNDFIIELLSGMYDVVLYRFNNRENFLTFIISGRNDYVSDAFKEFFKSPIWYIKFFIGGGAFLSFRSAYVEGMTFDTLEMDLFDIFFMYGALGAFIYLIILFMILKKSYNRSKIIFILFLMFVFHSVLAGHVVFDGLPIISGLILYLMILNINIFKSKFMI